MFSKEKRLNAIAVRLFSIRKRLAHTSNPAVDQNLAIGAQSEMNEITFIPEKEGPLRRLNLKGMVFTKRLPEPTGTKLGVGSIKNTMPPSKQATLVEIVGSTPLEPKYMKCVTAPTLSSDRTPQDTIYEQHSYRNQAADPMQMVKIGTGSARHSFLGPIPDWYKTTLFSISSSYPLKSSNAGQVLPYSTFNVQDTLMPLTQAVMDRIAVSGPAHQSQADYLRSSDRQNVKSSSGSANSKNTRKISYRGTQATLKEMSMSNLPQVNIKNKRRKTQQRKIQQRKLPEPKSNKTNAVQLASPPALSHYSFKHNEPTQHSPAARPMRKMRRNATPSVTERPLVPSFFGFEQEVEQINPNPEPEKVTKKKKSGRRRKLTLPKPKIPEPQFLDSFPSMGLWNAVAKMQLEKAQAKAAEVEALRLKQALREYTRRKSKTAKAPATPLHQRTEVPSCIEKINKLEIEAKKIAEEQLKRERAKPKPKIEIEPIPTEDALAITAVPLNLIPMTPLQTKPVPFNPIPSNQIPKSPNPTSLTPFFMPIPSNLTPVNQIPKYKVRRHPTRMAQSNLGSVKPVLQKVLSKPKKPVNPNEKKSNSYYEISNVQTKSSTAEKQADKSNQLGIVMQSANSFVEQCKPRSRLHIRVPITPENLNKIAKNDKTYNNEVKSEPMPAAIVKLQNRKPQEGAVSEYCRAAKTLQKPARKKFY